MKTRRTRPRLRRSSRRARRRALKKSCRSIECIAMIVQSLSGHERVRVTENEQVAVLE